MRAFSGPLQVLLSQPEVAVFFLVSYGEAKFTSLATDVTVNGTTYYAQSNNAALVTIQPPVMSSTLDKSSYKLVFSDPSFYFRASALSGKVGFPVRVDMGVYNAFQTPLQDSLGVLRAPGEPLLGAQDIFTIYAGYADSQSYSVDFEGNAVFTVACSSPFGKIDSTKAYYTSKGFLSAKFENMVSDTTYDKVFEGNTETRIKWGRA